MRPARKGEAWKIDLSRLDYTFATPPLLIGGVAMGVLWPAAAGADVDFVITPADYEGLARRYPDHLRDLWGDLGVAFSSSRSGRHLPARYDDLALGAIAAEGYRIISLERLLLLKAFGYKVEKYRRDLELIADRLLESGYALVGAVCRPSSRPTIAPDRPERGKRGAMPVPTRCPQTYQPRAAFLIRRGARCVASANSLPFSRKKSAVLGGHGRRGLCR